jgi:hypothetical protein
MRRDRRADEGTSPHHPLSVPERGRDLTPSSPLRSGEGIHDATVRAISTRSDSSLFLSALGSQVRSPKSASGVSTIAIAAGPGGFGSPEQGLTYLARYTHRVAVSNRRLVALDEETVTFQVRTGTAPTMGDSGR